MWIRVFEIWILLRGHRPVGDWCVVDESVDGVGSDGVGRVAFLEWAELEADIVRKELLFPSNHTDFAANVLPLYRKVEHFGEFPLDVGVVSARVDGHNDAFSSS